MFEKQQGSEIPWRRNMEKVKFPGEETWKR
jgi:hypothetical protein